MLDGTTKKFDVRGINSSPLKYINLIEILRQNALCSDDDWYNGYKQFERQVRENQEKLLKRL